jgi:hypothetical protein
MSSFFFFFFKNFMGVQFCYIAKNGDHPQENLARFGYKLHMKVIFFLKHPFFGVRGKWANLFAPCKRKMAIFKIDFG